MGKALPDVKPRSAARPPTRRVRRPAGRIKGYLDAHKPVARGLLLFAALVIFTLGYAFLLQQLSASSDAPGEQPAPAVAPPVAARIAPAQAPPAAPAAEQRVASEPAAASYQMVDDALPAASGERFTYLGQWDHISNIHDGRSQGTSSRSYHIGATAAFQFTGTRLKLYGIRGPSGGYAELRIDGQTYSLLHFYAPRKEPGILVYTSPALSSGTHDVDIVVAQPPDGLPKRRFVNIDGAAYAGR